MASNRGIKTSSTVSDEDKDILKQFSEFHIHLNELQESNKRILNRLDNLLQTQEEDHRMGFQEEHGNVISELENRISLIESHDRKREKELEELQQSLKIMMEKSDHCYGNILSKGDLKATVPSLGENVEINAAGISNTGAFQQQSDMVAVGRTLIQQEVSFVTPEHCSSTMEGFMEVEDSKSHTTSSTNLLSRQETERLMGVEDRDSLTTFSKNVLSRQETERPFLEGSVSRDGSELRVFKPHGAEFSALDVPGSENAVHNVIKGHPSSLRDSEETSVDTHVPNISGPEMEGQAITKDMSSSESSTIDASVDNQTQSNRAVQQEGDIVSACNSVYYNLGSVQRKDIEQRDSSEKKTQPPSNAYTERKSGYVSSASDTRVHSDHMLIDANSLRHSINKNSDSGGKNSRPQKSKTVVPKVKQAATYTDSYSNQPVLKLRAPGHVTLPDHQIQRNSSHVAELQGSINFSKNKQPIKENIDLDYDVKEEDIEAVMWPIYAKVELEEARMNKTHGIPTVLCVDISASMRGGGAWKQAQIFVNSFLSGLEEVVNEGMITNHDSVSLSVFGHETKVVQRLTNDFHLLHTSFDNLKLGGPTQMYGGLWMAMAGGGVPAQANFNHILIYPRIILISDGKPTSPGLRAGPDVYHESDQEQIESKIFDVVDNITENDIQIHCIPVGSDPHMRFLEKIATKSKGKMFTYKDGRYLARRSRNVPFAGHVLHHWKSMNTMRSAFGGEVSLEDLILGMEKGSLAAMSMPGSGAIAHQSKDDKEHILALAKEALEDETFTEEYISSSHYESTDPSSDLPPLGSRVRRGPDWDHGMQDNGGPGTVIGHNKNRKHEVYVTWDNDGKTANYRYGPQGYDVVLVEEPRLLQFDELIGTGCVVQRGKDWKGKNEDCVPGTKGVVIKVMEDGQVIVKWPNKSQNIYRYGADGCFDVEICDPFEDSSDGRTMQAANRDTLSFGRQETNNNNSSLYDGASASESSATAHNKNQMFGKNTQKNKNAQ